MKKRRILVSLALASAALFSLAACGKTESTPTPTPAPTSAAPAPATSSTPAASSSVQAADKVTVKYIAKYSDGAADEELTALATQIDKNTKATAPAENPTKDGYVFKGFRNKTTHLPFDFNANITKNTDIVAYFYKPGTYDEIAASDDVVMAYDFDDAEIGATLSAYDANVTGLSNDKDADAETYGATVVVKDYHNMLKTYDLGSGQTKVLFNIKDAIENSKVTIFTRFKLDGTMGSNWPFFEVLTKNGTEEEAAYGFGGDGNKKLGYRIGDGGYQNYKDELLEADKEYNALFEVDTDAKTIKLTLNGEAFDPVSANFDNVTGIRFVTGGSAGSYTGHSDERFIIIDQFAVKAEANDIATVKAGAKASVKAVYDAYVTSDKDSHLDDDLEWKAVLNAYNAACTETTGTIDSATDAAGVKTARDAAITAIETAVNNLRNAKIAEINTLLAANDTTDPTTPAGTWFWENGTGATEKYRDKYDNETDATKKAGYITSLNALKATYRAKIADLQNIKAGYALLAEFEAEANAIVLAKVDVTVKYYQRVYNAATGITEFATGTTYYTLEDKYVPKSYLAAWVDGVTYYTKAEDVYTEVNKSTVTEPVAGTTYYTLTQEYKAVATDATFDGTKTYYTEGVTSIGTDGSYKAVKDQVTSFADVPALTNYVSIKAFANPECTTPFDFSTAVASNITMHVLVGQRIAFINFNEAVGNDTSNTAKYATDGTKIAFGNYVTYSAKNGATITALSSPVTIEGESVSKYLNSNGKADGNKGWFEIGFDTVAPGKKAMITVYETGTSETDSRILWISTAATDISSDSKRTAAAAKKVVEKTITGNTLESIQATDLSTATNYYAIADGKTYIYAISIVVY